MSKDIAPLPHDIDPDEADDALARGYIVTPAGRKRQVVPVFADDTPTRPIPEEEWARTQEARIWYLTTEKGLTSKDIAAQTGLTPNAVRQARHQANKALEKFGADPGWVDWPVLIDFVREKHFPNELYGEEEDDLYDDEKGLTYAELSRKLDDEDKDYEPEFFPDEPEPD